METKTHPEIPYSRMIAIDSLEDLAKVGEELGRPILLYTSSNNNEYRFYILEDSLMYEYELKLEDKVKIITHCPNCRKKIAYGDYPGKKIDATCSNCGTSGIVFIEKPNKDTPWEQIVSSLQSEKEKQ